MRGRQPRPLTILPADVPILSKIARSRTRPMYQIQRARILLGVAGGERIAAVAEQAQADEATIWRVCRRYEHRGLTSVLDLAVSTPKASSAPIPETSVA